jgi:hypothetical protein
MQNIKSLLETALKSLLVSLEKVDAVKSFPTTEKVLNDAEKIVFKDAAIALGDYSFINELYSIGLDKIRHKVQILYFIKSDIGMQNSGANINLIVAELRNNNFNIPTLLLGNVNASFEYKFLTDRTSYVVMEYSVTEIQER